VAWRIAVDIGGTFTDGVIEETSTARVFLAKQLTTQSDPGKALAGVIASLLQSVAGLASAKDIDEIVHGSTLVTNSLIERKGVPTALITTRGMADVIDIGREVRYDLYDLNIQMPEPLVPRELRFEIDERVLADGAVEKQPAAGELDRVAAAIKATGARAVAVSLLNACVNPENEILVGKALSASCPDVAISLSSRVAREMREYERTTTTIANAYVQPLVAKYLGEIEGRLREAGIDARLRLMVSSGGSTSPAVATAAPITMLESGPAGGVLSAMNAGICCGLRDVLAFDMGGTTAKICTIADGVPSIVQTFEAARVRRFKKGSGFPLLITSIDLIEIGAGGGSIAKISNLGLLTVGPESAGADPGPACYGQGGAEPTVTDADLALGYLNPGYFLGGRMKLDATAANAALDRVGKDLSLPAVEVAKGIFNIVNEAMAGAARVHIAEKAQDPRKFTLVATGGAGPVHAVEIARKLRIPRVLFPIAAGTGSCLGFLVAPMRVERSWSKTTYPDQLDRDEINGLLNSSRAEAENDLKTVSLSRDDVDWSILVEARYVGQGSSLTLALPYEHVGETFEARLTEMFRAAYRKAFGGVLPAGRLEIVTWRVVGVGRQSVREYVWPSAGAAEEASPAKRKIFSPQTGRFVDASIYKRYALQPGTRLRGPLVLEEAESTIVVPMVADVEIMQNRSVLVSLES